MLADRVRCTVANPGAVSVGSTIALGATPTGYRAWLAAFLATSPAYFVLSDGLGRTITGVWTVNAGATATITEILWNDRLESTAGETFSSTCTAWSWFPAKEVVTTRSTPWGGLRNLIINGNPLINQRAYVSGAATSGANQYTLDRWRVVTSGQNASWTDSAGVRTVTAPAGGMEQVIEGLGLIGGTYVANWGGTATCTVGGAAVTKGVAFTVTGGADLTVRMTGGTWSKLQIEPGTVATVFEQRHYGVELGLCQRYYWSGTGRAGGSTPTGVAVLAESWIGFQSPMRAVPTLVGGTPSLTNAASGAPDAPATNGFRFLVQSNAAAGNFAGSAVCTASAEL